MTSIARESETPALALVEQGLREIGYTNGLLKKDYAFADLLTESDTIRRVQLAAFAQEPPSYRNACFGVLSSVPDQNVGDYRALGAPQLLELEGKEIRRWKVTASGTPEILQLIPTHDILRTIRQHKADWGPDPILRAKSIAFDLSPVQLDFFDTGLLPVIESAVYSKLDRLLRDALAASKITYEERDTRPLDYPKLFRLIFRLLAAKMFADRGQPGNWMQKDPAAVVSAVEGYYFKKEAAEPVLDDPAVQEVAWSKIRSAFDLQNISGEALAYVYENTLVSPETRQQYGTHSTPRELAEYIVRRLPFEELPVDERRVFEPFAGHAAFLIAALGRLRSLLPSTTNAAERHGYFVRMLSGIEIDSFAREVAWLSLMLADYPNPDGWRLSAGDIFASPLLDKELSHAKVVLCNPPFENFRPDERARYSGLRSTSKAADILQRTLEKAPDLLGFVLPRTFIDGHYYRDARRALAEKYGSIELVALPDTAFQHSRMETVLLIAHDKGRPLSNRRSAEIGKKDYEGFKRTGRPAFEELAVPSVHGGEATARPSALWLRPLQRVWGALDGLPVLSDEADIRNGIYYGLSLRKMPERLISKRPRPGFQPGLKGVDDGFEPLIIRGHVYMNMDPEVMYEWSRANRFPWDRQKVIVNRARLSTGHWVVTAAPDLEGLVAYHLFHGMWPTGDLSLDVLAAIVNGPVANAFMSTNRTSRDNRIETLYRVPIPQFRSESLIAIVAAVTEYRNARLSWLAGSIPESVGEARCRQALMHIDAELLAAYDLPPRVERELLDYFEGHPRPGPVPFDRYYPPDFRPALPFRMLVSGEVQRASAKQTLQRLPVLRDAVISEALSEIE